MSKGAAHSAPEAASGGGGFKALMAKIWWLHSFGALAFGVGVMLFARAGLAYADKVLMVLALSWIFVFVAFRFIVGPANRKPDERFVKKGVRLVTNYVIKQLYQQMFFFLVPLYASSAIWSLSTPTWWIVPLLLLCAVLSTMDLVFDNFIMEHRNIASGMYGLCFFAVLNLMLPLVFRFSHFNSLMIAAVVTPPAIAFLSYPLPSVTSGRGLGLTTLASVSLGALCFFGHSLIPPAPMSMSAGGIGHGRPGSYECVPGPLREMKASQLDRLRCVTEITEPGGLNDEIVHVWSFEGKELARIDPLGMEDCQGNVLKSDFAHGLMPEDPVGKWTCTAETEDGQVVGHLSVRVVEDEETSAPEPKAGDAGPGGDAAPKGDAGSESSPDASAP